MNDDRAGRYQEPNEDFPHATKLDAERHMVGLLRNGAVRLHVYRCRYCSRPSQPAVWHVGHPTGSMWSR